MYSLSKCDNNGFSPPDYALQYGHFRLIMYFDLASFPGYSQDWGDWGQSYTSTIVILSILSAVMGEYHQLLDWRVLHPSLIWICYSSIYFN